MRLIDADVLIEAMKKTEEEYEDAMTCPSWWTAYNAIKEQPTAYDVEKVVAELEKHTRTMMPVIPAEEAIDIVKAGGINE